MLKMIRRETHSDSFGEFEVIASESRFKFPKISVVMSVYNGAQYLEESVESVLNQTFKDFEFIIVNDGSTDTSSEMLEEYTRRDDRIVLIQQQNMGLTNSLIRGCGIVNGEFIARQDAGDIFYPPKLASQLDWFMKHPKAVLCGTNVDYIDINGIRFITSKFPCENDRLKKILWKRNTFREFPKNNLPTHWFNSNVPFGQFI